jgi:hypothetical protein
MAKSNHSSVSALNHLYERVLRYLDRPIKKDGSFDPHSKDEVVTRINRFSDEYAAGNPWDGDIDFMTTEKMNTENMSLFLSKSA